MLRISPMNTSSVDWNQTIANNAHLWQFKLTHPGQKWYYFETHISSLFLPRGMEVGVKDLSVQFFTSIMHTMPPNKQEHSVFWGQETSNQTAIESVELWVQWSLKLEPFGKEPYDLLCCSMGFLRRFGFIMNAGGHCHHCVIEVWIE